MKYRCFAPRPAALLCAGALLLALSGCGGSSKSYGAAYDTTDLAASLTASEEAYDFSDGVGMSSADAPQGEPGAAAETGETVPASSRKIIYNAYLDMEATDFAAAQAALLQAVEDAGGYLESSNLGGSAERQSRWANYTARIPADRYRAFLAAAGSAASVLSQSETAQDITSSYIDVEARLSALNSQRDRLNALADKAETTADLLEIESQLSDVQYQIENYTRQLRAMDDQVGYSTVDISLSEVAVLTPVDDSFATRIANAFSSGWRDFGRSCQGIAVAAVYLMPVLLLAALVLALAVVFGRRRRARRAALRAQPPQEAQYPAAPKDPAAPEAPDSPSGPKYST